MYIPVHVYMYNVPGVRVNDAAKQEKLMSV